MHNCCATYHGHISSSHPQNLCTYVHLYKFLYNIFPIKVIIHTNFCDMQKHAWLLVWPLMVASLLSVLSMLHLCVIWDISLNFFSIETKYILKYSSHAEACTMTYRLSHLLKSQLAVCMTNNAHDFFIMWPDTIDPSKLTKLLKSTVNVKKMGFNEKQLFASVLSKQFFFEK